MGLYSTPIPNLIQGVSQQPDALRLLAQCEAMVNCLPSVVEGLKKRPPTQSVAKLLTSTPSSAFIHTINRDSTERYTVVITPGGNLQVFNMAGMPMTVNTPDGVGYITSSDPASDLRAVTIADYTFILNRQKVPAMDTVNKSPNPGVGAIIYVKQAQYSSTYKVFINDDTTPRSNQTTAATGTIDSSAIAAQIKTDLATALGTSWSVSTFGPIVFVRRNDGADFDIKVTDGRANTLLRVFKDQCQRFTDLPTSGKNGWVLKVAGDKASDQDDYYVKFKCNNSAADLDEGVWVETVANNIPWQFDTSTMPFALVRTAFNTFTLQKITWTKRQCGDTDSAPDPSFVGKKINDLFFFKNRLGFLSDENVIMSEVGEFFNFFPTTVQEILDSDPIDVAGGSSNVSILNHAIAFDEKLLLLSKASQFVLEGGQVLSPKDVTINLTTQFENSETCKPVNAGKTVVFAVPLGDYSGAREYFTDGTTGTNDAVDITEQVPMYIPANLSKMAAATNENILVALSSNDRTRLFPYRYFWNNADKVQSAWSEWNFNGAQVLNMDFIDSVLWLVIARNDGVYLEKMDISAGFLDPGAQYATLLDRRVGETACTVVYDPLTGVSTITLPYTPNPLATTRVVSRTGPGMVPGIAYTVSSVVGNTLTVQGDVSSKLFYVGEVYTSTFQFSEIKLRESGPNGTRIAISSGRTILRTITVAHDRTGYVKAKVTYKNRSSEPKASEYVFSGIRLGSPSSTLGNAVLATGQIRFLVGADPSDVMIELINDSHLPSFLLSADVELWYHIRSQRA